MNTDNNETTRQYFDRLLVLRQQWCAGELDEMFEEEDDAALIYVNIKNTANEIWRSGEEEDKARVKEEMEGEGYEWKGDEIGWRDY